MAPINPTKWEPVTLSRASVLNHYAAQVSVKPTAQNKPRVHKKKKRKPVIVSTTAPVSTSVQFKTKDGKYVSFIKRKHDEKKAK